jgi:hypothetical protein
MSGIVMSRAKVQKMNIFKIIFNGLMIYIKNFIPLTRIMLFPVLGQLLGIILILYPSYMLTKNATKFVSINAIADNILFFYLLLIVIVIPGFFIFTKAFWEYMIATVSLNPVIAAIIKQGSIKNTEIKIQNQAVKLRTKSYILLLFILMLIWLIALILPSILLFFGKITPLILLGFALMLSLMIIIASILSIYLSLSFQIFAFETIPVINILKKSFNLVKENFWRTVFLGTVLFIITSVLVPPVFQTLIEKTVLLSYVLYPFKIYTAALIGDPTVLTQIGSQLGSQVSFLAACSNPDAGLLCITNISTILVLSTVGIIVTALMLPLGSACYTLLYFDIITRKK